MKLDKKTKIKIIKSLFLSKTVWKNVILLFIFGFLMRSVSNPDLRLILTLLAGLPFLLKYYFTLHNKLLAYKFMFENNFKKVGENIYKKEDKND